jgi:hypothetical protein
MCGLFRAGLFAKLLAFRDRISCAIVRFRGGFGGFDTYE